MTNAETLPEPLVPAEVDLRGLEYMPMLGHHLYGSDFDALASDREFRAAHRLWWAAWNQQPAASLPNNERALCKHAGLGEEVSKWRKVRDRALHGFVLCSDGRLYHRFLAPQAMIAWEKRKQDQAKRDAEARRKAEERQQRAALFARLREAGVTPEFNAPTKELRALVRRHFPDESDDESHPMSRGQSHHPVTRTVTAKTGRDGTGRDVEEELSTAAGASRAPAPAATPAAVGVALKGAGLSPVTFNLSDPVLLALLEQGATVAEFEGLAREALDKGIGKPWPWVLKALQGRRADATRVALAPVMPASRQEALEQRNRSVAEAWAAEHQGATQ